MLVVLEVVVRFLGGELMEAWIIDMTGFEVQFNNFMKAAETPGRFFSRSGRVEVCVFQSVSS